jgi:AAA15 family ATPase/GTPase
MLKEVTIENYKSFDKPQLFSMEACAKNKVGELEEHVTSLNDNRILRISSIYGPNGGGKSNLIKAIMLPSKIVRQNSNGLDFDNFNLLGYYDEDSTSYETFIFSKNKASKETIFFVNKDYEIGYRFEVSFSSVRNERFLRNQEVFLINHESVTYRRTGEKTFKPLFERGNNGLIDSTYFSKVDLIKNKIALSPYISFIHYIANTYLSSQNINSDIEFDVIKSLYSELISINFFSSLTYRSFVGPIEKNAIIENKQSILNALLAAGIPVKDIIVKTSEGISKIYLSRTCNGGKDYLLPLSSESDGTKKLFALLVTLVTSPKNVILLGDGFDSQLHPKLIQAVLAIFTNPISQRQFIFNSHDFINMTNENFRRDEIWFAYRNDEYATIIFPLSSVVNYQGKPIRNDAKYSKQYLENRYGADPFIKKGLSLL